MIKVLLKGLLLLIPVLSLVAAINYFVDPAGVFEGGAYEEKIVSLMLEGHDVEGRGNYDERLLQRKYASRIVRAPQLLVLGSSRSLPIPHDAVGSADFYNASVSSAKMMDLLAVYEVFRQRSLVPKVVLLECADWLFNADYHNDRWKTLDREYRAAMDDMDLLDIAAETGASAQWSRSLALISPSYLRASLDSVRHGKFDRRRKEPEANADFQDSGGKSSDGSLRWSLTRRTDRGEVTRYARDHKRYNMTVYHMRYDEIDPDLLATFEAFVDRIRGDGVSVVMMLSPYHPLTFEDYAGAEDGQIVFDVERVFRDIAAARGIPVIGSYDPAAVGVTDADFVDGLHLTQQAMVGILQSSPVDWEALVEAPEVVRNRP